MSVRSVDGAVYGAVFRAWPLRLVLMGAACAMPAMLPRAAHATAPASQAIASYEGRWKWVGGEAETKKIDAAIEGVVQKMNFLIRGIARRKLRGPNIPSNEVVIQFTNGQIVIARPGRPTVAAPQSGATIDWKSPEGDQFKVSHAIEDGVLYQRFSDPRATTVNRFLLEDGGRRMRIETNIDAKRLPAPLSFATTYARISR